MEEQITHLLEVWARTILSNKFKSECAKYMISLGYTSRTSGDQLFIINGEGENSGQPGTLVGWRFVNEMEDYLGNNGFPWFISPLRSQEELSKASTFMSTLTKEITELIKNDN
jgi:hypothetical protein